MDKRIILPPNHYDNLGLECKNPIEPRVLGEIFSEVSMGDKDMIIKVKEIFQELSCFKLIPIKKAKIKFDRGIGLFIILDTIISEGEMLHGYQIIPVKYNGVNYIFLLDNGPGRVTELQGIRYIGIYTVKVELLEYL